MTVEENFEVVRRCLATFEDDPEEWLETLDPDIEWYPEEEGHALIRGREAARLARKPAFSFGGRYARAPKRLLRAAYSSSDSSNASRVKSGQSSGRKTSSE